MKYILLNHRIYLFIWIFTVIPVLPYTCASPLSAFRLLKFIQLKTAQSKKRDCGITYSLSFQRNAFYIIYFSRATVSKGLSVIHPLPLWTPS